MSILMEGLAKTMAIRNLDVSTWFLLAILTLYALILPEWVASFVSFCVRIHQSLLHVFIRNSYYSDTETTDMYIVDTLYSIM